MLIIDRIIGSRAEPAMSERLHVLEHKGLVDTLRVEPADIERRRLRVRTEAGAEIAVALPREQKLYDGAVLLLEPTRAIVVRVNADRWLRLTPHSVEDAVELGYHAGNLHWRVRFEGACLLVALEAPVEDYLGRLGALFSDRRVAAAIEGSRAAAAHVAPPC